MSEINDIIELLEGIFSLKINDQYQWIDPSLIAKYKTDIYKYDYFFGGSNIYMNLITHENKIVILFIQKITY